MKSQIASSLSEFLKHLLVLPDPMMATERRLAWLLTVAIAGCGGAENAGPALPGHGAGPVAESDPLEPVPFESMALASDESYESPRADAGAQAGDVRELTHLKIRFHWCPPGSFSLGTSHTSEKHLLNEGPVDVTFSKGFWMQETELTQNQYEQLMGPGPSFHKGPENPVDSVTWDEAVEFCRRLSELPPEKKAGNLFRLPTEAEWEYACRAGTTTEFSFGDDESLMDQFAWYSANSNRTTHPVAQKKPNAWGLCDMHGNVAEWCLDFYGEYPQQALTDPRGPESGAKRTLRGGGWFHLPVFARSAHRDGSIPLARYFARGFRLVATIAETDTQAEVSSAVAPPDGTH